MSTQFAPIWNNASVDLTCIRANVTNTNSGSGSTLLDLLVDGSSKFKVSKDGNLTTSGSLAVLSGSTTTHDSTYFSLQAPGGTVLIRGKSTYGRADLDLGQANGITSFLGPTSFNSSISASGFSISSVPFCNLNAPFTGVNFFGRDGSTAAGGDVHIRSGNPSSGVSSVIINSDAGLLVQNRANNAFSILSASLGYFYNTYTDASNYERAKIAWSSNVLQIGTEGLGTGAVTPRSMEFQTNGTTRLTIDGSTGAVILPNSSSTSSFLLRGAAYATTGINIQAGGSLVFSGSGAGLDLTVASNVIVHRGLQIGPSDGLTELYQAGSPSGTQTGVLEQRYTTCPQTYRIYATRISSTNYERAKLEWATDGSVFRIGTEKGSGGGSAKPLEIQTDGTTRLTIGTAGAFTIADALNISVGTTTGTKIATATNQKLGFWNATPDVQPTTAVAAATLVGNGGNTITDTDTFDGYTLKQIVKALRNIGLLA